MADKFDLYDHVTKSIIAAMEAGTPPWRKPWTGDSAGAAFPLRANGEPYRGINVLMLWLEAGAKGYASAHWFTYKQAQEIGGQVRKGEKSATVVKYGTVEKEGEDGEERRFAYPAFFCSISPHRSLREATKAARNSSSLKPSIIAAMKAFRAPALPVRIRNSRFAASATLCSWLTDNAQR